MKKIVLICGAVVLSFTAFSQNKLANPGTSHPAMPKRILSGTSEVAPAGAISNPAAVASRNGSGAGNGTQSVITLGTAANALTAVGIRNFVWASPYSNTVMFTRRAVGGVSGPVNGGRIFYDISYDGGVTWDTAHGPVWIPDSSTVLVPSNARYPQGAIYNPVVNSTNDSADGYMTYYAATLNNTNPSGTTNWGGNAYGTHKLDNTVNPTMHEISSDPGSAVWYVIPELLHMCKNGNTFALSESDWGDADLNGRGVAYDYNGTMVWQKGTWNTTTNEYDYTRQLMSVPAGDLPYNRWYSHPYAGGSTITDPVSTMLGSSIAFNDNGMVGYMVCKLFSNNTESPDSSAIFHIYKTTDGGTTWNRTTNTPDFDEIDKLCVDSGFGMGISGQVFDITIDANDNVHIVIVVGTDYNSDLYGTSQYYYENYGSIFDIMTTDGGTTWFAHKLKTNPIEEVYGVMGDPATAANRQVYDNRPQITRSYDGTKLFFSWFETDTTSWLPLAANLGYNNQNPDMHVVGYDVTSGLWTTEYNATAFPALAGDADGACWLGSVAYYALTNGSGGHKIPTVIGTPTATSTNNNPDWQLPFSFKYLDGIEVPSGAYTVANVLAGAPNPNHVELLPLPTATNNVTVNNDFIVAPVRPNPFSGSTELMVQISKPGTVMVEVRNVLGQIVSADTYSNQSSGLHTYTIDGSQLEKGIYLYTVTYNGQQITNKMNVQ